MTRINVVPVQELCDEHLRAEHRELTRIPNSIAIGKLTDLDKIPKEYVLGKGHVYFFTDKLMWLQGRYSALCNEMKKRGFKTEDRWPKEVNAASMPSRFGMYIRTPEALKINRGRIKDRWPKNAHYYRKRINRETDSE